MQPVSASPTAPASGAPYQLSQTDMVRNGRWRAYWRAFWMTVFLVLLALPSRLVATDHLASVDSSIPNSVPVRMSLMIDAALILAYVLLAVRAWDLVPYAEERPPLTPGTTRQRRWAGAALAMVVVGALGNVVQDVYLWVSAGSEDSAVIHTPWAPIPWTLAVAGLALGFAAARREQGRRVRAAPKPGPKAPPDLVLCCSGGGIRAASFCLGGLQALGERYRNANAVIGVSGGGYIAAALHVHRWKSSPTVIGQAPSALGHDSALRDATRDLSQSGAVGQETPPDDAHVVAAREPADLETSRVPETEVASTESKNEGASTEPAGKGVRPKPADEPPTDNQGWGNVGPPYAPGTAEEAWLRRHTRYLFDSPAAGVFAALSLLYGLAVNLLFITAILGGTAWLASWFFLASGALRNWDKSESVALEFGEGWGWVHWVWLVAALGVVLFFAGKAVDRGPNTFSTRWRDWIRRGIVALVVVGIALWVALLALPWLLDRLHDFAHNPGKNPGPLAAALAQLLVAMGFASPDDAAARSIAVPSASFVAIVAAVAASLRAISSSLTPADGKESRVGRALAAVWAKVKGVVIPWLAAVAVVVLLVAVFLTWTVALLNDVSRLEKWVIVWAYVAAVVLTYLFTDANRTSLHHYYRERLAAAYLVGEDERGLPKPVDYAKPLRYSESTPGDGGPALVTCAVANVSDIDVVPTGRECTPFVFSHDRIGLTEETLPNGALVRSNRYEFASDGRGRDTTIPSAVAISGAALSPLAGRENVKLRPYRLVLALANARLGVWLPNPLWVDEDTVARRQARTDAKSGSSDWKHLEGLKDVFAKPSPFLVAREGFGRTSVLDRYLYVTDGGHYDNLGLVEALRRRAKTVLVLDASNDDEDTFKALGQAIATARMDLGCEVHLDPSDMRRVEKGRAKTAWVRGTVTYRPLPDREEADIGQLWVAKAIMVDGLPWDEETYQGAHPEFPRTSTGRQLYGEFDLEAYRELGCAVVHQLLAKADELPDSRLSRDWPRNRRCLKCKKDFDVVTARAAYNVKYLGVRDYDDREDGRRCAACAISEAEKERPLVGAAL